MPSPRLLVLLFALLAWAAGAPARAEETQDHVVYDADAAPGDRASKFLYMFDVPARWPATIAWKYNPSGAPGAFSDTATTVARLQSALNKWTAVCAVTYDYQGTTATAPNSTPGGQPDLANVVGWGALQGSTAGVTWSWYSSQGGGTLVDGDIILSQTLVTSNGAMDFVAVHEWGHLLGLAHSDMNAAVMSGPPYSSYNNLATLTVDDVRGCRCLYGAAAGQSAGLFCTLPRDLAFGNVPAGSSSAPTPVTLRNDGDAPITLQAATFSSGGFGASGCGAGTVVAPGQACVLSLTFSPPTQAAYDVALSIPVAGESQPYRIQLSGSGTAPAGPAPSLAPGSATFASQALGTTSAAKALVLTNIGGGTLSITGFTPGGSHPGDFNRAGTCAIGTTLGTGVSCTIQLTFTPLASGARSATLAVGVSSGSVPSIALSGTGAASAPPPALSASTSSLGFADQQVGTQSAPQTFTVQNAGGGTLTLASIGLGGASAAEFLRTGSCGAGTVLGAAQTCTATIRFTPSTAGAKAATLDIVTSAGTAVVALAGNAIAPPTVPIASLLPASIDFGTLAVGVPGNPLQATIANAGSAPLVVGVASLIGTHASDFTIVAACPNGTVLQPGQSCGYSLRFQPQAGGARSASMRVGHNAAGSPSTVALGGTGNAPAVASIVVEYYHSAYDHYFITIGTDEIRALDTGVFGGWTRTGFTFKAYPTAQPGFASICRFYLPPGYGDTHFYSASPAECAIVDQQNPAFILESTTVMYLAIPHPLTGACPAGSDPVYRAWNRRADTNHRYTALRSVRDAMVALGYVAEGSGPDVVTFCAPR